MTNYAWSNPQTWTPKRLEAPELNIDIRDNMQWLYEREIVTEVRDSTYGNTVRSITSPLTVGLATVNVQQLSILKVHFTAQVSHNTIDGTVYIDLYYQNVNAASGTSVTPEKGVVKVRNAVANYRTYVNMMYYIENIDVGYYNISVTMEPTTGTCTLHRDRIPSTLTVEVI